MTQFCQVIQCLIQIYNLIVGDGSLLYKQTIATFTSALAPGTYANKYRQAASYLRFALSYNVDYLNPTVINICMFSQLLANNHDSPTSVKNYLAGAKSWVYEHGGNISAFLTSELSTMSKSIAKHSDHVTHRATPLKWYEIEQICMFLDSASNCPLAVKPCILIGYSCMLRASNLLSNPGSVVGPHTLLARNIFEIRKGLIVVINTSKSTFTPYSVTIHRLSDHKFCPVVAWNNYKSIVSPPSTGPAFLMPDRSPLNSKTVVALMKAALANSPSRDVNLITMHSLRRGAAQDAEASGIPLKTIMKRGAWRSKSGIKPYLSK